MKLLTKTFIFAAITAGCLTTDSFATQITSSSDPSLTGSTLIDFTGSTNGSYSSLAIGNVTFSGNGNIVIDSVFGGSYNTSGTYLQNSAGGTTSLLFQFGSAVSAFGFNLGAHDYTWTLRAFNSSNLLLDTYAFPAIGGSNAGQFYGIAASGISYATVSTGSSDYVLLDNFRYTTGSSSSSVPDGGSTLALLGFAMTAVAGARRKFGI